MSVTAIPIPEGASIGPPIGAMPIPSGATIGGQPQSTIGPRVPAVIDPENKVQASGFVPPDIEHYTQEGRAEHPILSRVGDLISGGRELLFGGQAADKPMGTSAGAADLAGALITVPEGAEVAAGAEEAITKGIDAYKVAKAARAAKAAEEAETAAVESGNQLLKTRPKDFRNDVVPGRAIATENVDPDLVESANHARVAKDTVAERQHMEAIQKHLEDSISNLKEQQVTLLKHPSGVDVDLRPIVEDSYKKALTEAQKTGSPEIVKAINKAHEEMLKIPNSDGELIADRYLTQSADESSEAMQETKKEFQGRSNYNATGGNTPDTPQRYANNLWKDVSAKVRLQLEDQVPGLGEVNTRIRDARAAADLAKKRVDTLRGMPPLPSKMDRFLKVAKPALVKGIVGGAGATVGGGIIYDLYKAFLSGE